MSELSFEENFEQMLEEQEEAEKSIRVGAVVEGTVFSVKPDEIILSIPGKSEGVILRNDYSADNTLDLTTVTSVGETMEAIVTKITDGEPVSLSYRRLAQEKGNQKLREAFESEAIITAKVTQILKGGLGVDVEGARVFIPASLVSDSFERDLSKFLDQEIEFQVTEFNPQRRRIIGNRKQLLVARKAAMQEELLARIAPGDIIEGTVKNITDFGAFIDLGGIDGLLHISEMSWGRVENPRKVFTVGETVRVFIKDINGTKIALSRKFADENPWNGAAERFAVGNVVTGRVARMTDFGAFIELAPGVDALLHVSQISRNHVDKPSDVLSVGQEVEAKIVDFREADHKISLSIKQLEAVPPTRLADTSDEAVSIDIDAYVAAHQPESKEETPAVEEAAEEAAEAVAEAAEAAEEAAEEAVEEAAEAVAETAEEAVEAATEAVEEVAEEAAEETEA